MAKVPDNQPQDLTPPPLDSATQAVCQKCHGTRRIYVSSAVEPDPDDAWGPCMDCRHWYQPVPQPPERPEVTVFADDLKRLCHKVRLSAANGEPLYYSQRMALERCEALVGRMENSPNLPMTGMSDDERKDRYDDRR